MLKPNFWNTDGYTNKNSDEQKKLPFGVIKDELIQVSYKIGLSSKQQYLPDELLRNYFDFRIVKMKD